MRNDRTTVAVSRYRPRAEESPGKGRKRTYIINMFKLCCHRAGVISCVTDERSDLLAWLQSVVHSAHTTTSADGGQGMWGRTRDDGKIRDHLHLGVGHWCIEMRE